VTNRNLHAQLFEQTAAISRQQHAAKQQQHQPTDKLIRKEVPVDFKGEVKNTDRKRMYSVAAATNRFGHFIVHKGRWSCEQFVHR